LFFSLLSNISPFFPSFHLYFYLFRYPKFPRSRGSSVSIVTELHTGRLPAGAAMGTGGCFPGGKAAGA
jgi:hypothetical protein